MALNNKSLGLVQEIKKIMEEIGIKMTIRQIYYQLVSKHLIENNLKAYKKYDWLMTRAREQGLIDAFSIVDTSKPIIKHSSWDDLKDFFDTVKDSYKKKVWTNQDKYVEVWLEKDALRGVFEPITTKFDSQLMIGKGYQSFTNLIKSTTRLNELKGKDIHILYFGDFDPTGLDIPRNIKDRLEKFGAEFSFHNISLTKEQIEKYELPPDLAKKTDSRAKKFISEHGDIAVELDALPPKVLQELITNSITEYLDIDIFNSTIENEKDDLIKIQDFINTYKEEN